MNCQVRDCEVEAHCGIEFDCDAIPIIVCLCSEHERELMDGGDPQLAEPRLTLIRGERA